MVLIYLSGDRSLSVIHADGKAVLILRIGPRMP
jgi:hypothetical protein